MSTWRFFIGLLTKQLSFRVHGRVSALATTLRASKRGAAGVDPVKSQQSNTSPAPILKKKRQSDLWFWLAMAAVWISSAFLVYVWLISEGSQHADGASDSNPTPAAVSDVRVTYGSVIKLEHVATSFRLHSHEVPYGSGSGQQSVTGFPQVNDANSYWVVKPAFKDKDARQGDTIAAGAVIRLMHAKTGKWLHSHLHQSPLTGNLEVSAFGSQDQSDTGDNWKLEIEGKGSLWTKDQKVRLYHVDTNSYLQSHDKKYMRVIPGQQEVCGVQKKNANNIWLAAEGIYLPKRTS